MTRRASERSTAVLAVATVVAVCLAGCSAFFPTDVTPTASVSRLQPVACSQQNAQLTWQPLQDAELGALGYRTLKVAPDGVQTHVDTEFDYVPTMTSDDLLATAYYEPQWLDFLVGEFGRTGQVSVPFDLTCAGDEVGAGVLTTSASPLTSTMVFCGEQTSVPAIDQNYLVQLRTYCPAS